MTSDPLRNSLTNESTTHLPLVARSNASPAACSDSLFSDVIGLLATIQSLVLKQVAPCFSTRCRATIDFPEAIGPDTIISLLNICSLLPRGAMGQFIDGPCYPHRANLLLYQF